MSSFLKDISNYLETNFQSNWLEDYLTSEGEIVESNQVLITDKIEKLLNETIEVFFKSLISGQYSKDTKFTIEEIQELKRKTDSILNLVTVDNPDTQKFLLAAVKINYMDILKVFSNIYLNFIKLVQSQNENPNIDIVYEGSFDTVKFFNQISNPETKNRVEFFELIVIVYKVDHFFKENVSTYRAINNLENLIKEHPGEKYFVLVKEKLNFLKYKWEIRQKSYKKKDFKVSKAYIIDDELFISTDDVKYNPSIQKLQIWKEHIESYYELVDWKSKISLITNDFKHQKYSELPSSKLILLLKYYKDINHEYGNLEEIVQEFKNRYEENCNAPQRFFYNKTYLYALNNQFSSLLGQKPANEKEIEKLKMEIQKIQKKCNIDNFFVESKHIIFRLKSLESRFENRAEFEDFSKAKDELDSFTSEINIYKEKLKWSKNNHNLLFQLPYEECLIDSNIDDLSVFYASSIVLPLPHEESETNYELINEKIKELKQLILSVVSLNKEFSTIKNLREDIKLNQIKTFETIGLFTAITAFILASIPSFSFVKEFYQALLFTGIIGSCLIIMISIIFLFTRGFRKKNSWMLICIGVVVFLFSILSLHKAINKVENDIYKKYSQPIEKLNKEMIDLRKTENKQLLQENMPQTKKPNPQERGLGFTQLKNQ